MDRYVVVVETSDGRGKTLKTETIGPYLKERAEKVSMSAMHADNIRITSWIEKLVHPDDFEARLQNGRDSLS